jgi:hypothetical protein
MQNIASRTKDTTSYALVERSVLDLYRQVFNPPREDHDGQRTIAGIARRKTTVLCCPRVVQTRR